jgi:hypothetical protein
LAPAAALGTAMATSAGRRTRVIACVLKVAPVILDAGAELQVVVERVALERSSAPSAGTSGGSWKATSTPSAPRSITTMNVSATWTVLSITAKPARRPSSRRRWSRAATELRPRPLLDLGLLCIRQDHDALPIARCRKRERQRLVSRRGRRWRTRAHEQSRRKRKADEWYDTETRRARLERSRADVDLVGVRSRCYVEVAIPNFARPGCGL